MVVRKSVKTLFKHPKICIPFVILGFLLLFFSFTELSSSFVLLLSAFLYSIMNEIGISMVYDLEKRGEIEISSAFNKCFSFDHLPSILVSSLLVEIIVLAGLLALVIPGLYLMCRLSLTGHATAIEEKGAIESIKRSWDLTRGRAGEVFGILLEAELFSIAFVIPALVLVLIGIASGIEVATITIIATGIGFIAFIFILALPVIAITYYYIELMKHGAGNEDSRVAF